MSLNYAPIGPLQRRKTASNGILRHKNKAKVLKNGAERPSDARWSPSK